MSKQNPIKDRLSGYVKALSSNYVLLAANVGTYALTVPWFLKWLGTERYGIWLIFLQLMYLVSLATTWIATPTVREAAACYVAADRQRTQGLFQTVFIYYAFLGTATVAFTIIGSRFVPQLFKLAPGVHAEATMALILISAYIAAAIQLNLLISLLTGFQRMHIANILLGTLTLVGTGLGISAVAAGLGLIGLVTGQLLSVVLVYRVGWAITRRIDGIIMGLRHFNCGLLLRLLRSGSAYVGYSISYLLLQSDILLVGLILGPIAAATYGVAYKVMDYAIQLIWKIPDSMFPMIAELDAGARLENLQHVHRLCGIVATAGALWAAIIISLYGHSGVVLWIGSENAAPKAVFVAFGILIILQVFVHSSLIISYGTDQMNSITRAALVEGGLKVVISVLLLPSIGMIAVAVGSIFAQMSLTAWYSPLRACRITGDSLRSYISEAIVRSLPAAIASSIVGVTTLFIIREIWFQVLISVSIVSIIYLIIFCLTQTIDNEEGLWFIEKVRLAFCNKVHDAKQEHNTL